MREMRVELEFERLDLTEEEAQTLVVEKFNALYYGRQKSEWMGYELQKCVADLFMYQEIIWKTRPHAIVETGTWTGGSALFLANICDFQNYGLVITVDTNNPWYGAPTHQRIMYVNGDSADPKVFDGIREMVRQFNRVMVILDSDHSKNHVLKELALYSELVTKDCYLVVEDTNIHGHPVRADLPEGPWEAVHEWLPFHKEFEIDKQCERFLLTHNPDGYLKRIK